MSLLTNSSRNFVLQNNGRVHKRMAILRDFSATMILVWAIFSSALAQDQDRIGLNKLIDRVSLQSFQANGPNLSQAFCDAGMRPTWVNAAKIDGMIRPSELFSALDKIWCQPELPTVDRARSLLPNVLPVRQQKRLGINLEDRVSNLEDLETFWYSPIDLSFDISSNGHVVRIFTVREGGGDEFEFRWMNQRWMLVRFRYGGAC